MLGPYIKFRGGTWGTKMSSNSALITMETYVQQGETRASLLFFMFLIQIGEKNRVGRSAKKKL